MSPVFCCEDGGGRLGNQPPRAGGGTLVPERPSKSWLDTTRVMKGSFQHSREGAACAWTALLGGDKHLGDILMTSSCHCLIY